jgi:hypothetical protein
MAPKNWHSPLPLLLNYFGRNYPLIAVFKTAGVAWPGSSKLYASTTLLAFEQSYAMNAVTGVTIIAQVIMVIIIIVIKGYPLITLAIKPLLLADSPRLLFQPPPNAPWYSKPPVRRLFHN